MCNCRLDADARACCEPCRKGRGALKFELDGQDRTGAEMKITQAAIDEAFSTDLLTRAVFFGQTEVNALLEVKNLYFLSD